MALPALLGVGAKAVGKSMVKSGGRAAAGKILGRGRKKQPGRIIPGREEVDGGKGGAIIKPKTSVISAGKLVPNSSNKKAEGQEKTVVIKEKLTTIAGLLEGTLASKKKEETDKKKKEQQERRGTREAKLEKKPKTKGKLELPNIPGMSFLDRIKQFIMNVLGGYLLYKLVEFAPLLTPILTGIMQVGEWLINFGGTLLNGLVTFIDLGYQAYDWTRDQVKNIFGEEGAKKFDDFAGLVNKLLNGVIIGAMVAIKVAEGAFLAAKIAKATAAISGTASAVTTGGAAVTTGAAAVTGGSAVTTGAAAVTGGSAVTTGVTAGGVAVTTSGGAGVGSSAGIGVGAVAGIIAGAGLLASGIGEGAFQLKKFGQGLEEGAKQRYEEKAWYDPRKQLDFAIYQGSQFINFTLGLIGGVLDIVGAPFRYAIELLRYPFLSQKDKEKQAKNLAKFDARVRENLREGLNLLTLGLGFKEKGSFGNIYGDESAQEEMTGKPKVQGRQEGGQIKPLDIPKKQKLNPNYAKGIQQVPQVKPDNDKSKFSDSVKAFNQVDYFGPILATATKILAGNDPSQSDYKSIGAGFSNLLVKGFMDGKLKNNLAIAYNDGGIVSANTLQDGPLASANLSRWVGDTFKGLFAKNKPNIEKTIKETGDTKTTKETPKTLEGMLKQAIESLAGISPEPDGGGSTDGPGSIATVRDTATGADISTESLQVPQVADGEWGSVLDLIYKYEAGPGGYESMYPGTTLPGATKMTIAEVASKATGAVGAWQNLPEYLNERARAVGLDPSTALYDKENQEKIAVYLIGRGQANVTKDLAMKNPKEAMLRLSKVWAAIPKDDSGVSYYAGVGNNAAHIKPQQMYNAFQRLQFGGEVDGQQGIDKVPAMLTSGEFVMDKDSTMAIQTAFPGFLSAVNKAEGQKAVEILMNYASYNDPTAGEIIVIDRKEVIAQAPMESESSTVPPMPSRPAINFKEILSFVG